MFGIFIILVIGLLNSFFLLEIIIIINTFPYPFTGALLSLTQIYSPGVAFLYRFKKLLWFIIFIFKPKSRIINLLKGYISWLIYKEMVKQLLIYRINH